jgi:membrane AbrB-like protein
MAVGQSGGRALHHLKLSNSGSSCLRMLSALGSTIAVRALLSFASGCVGGILFKGSGLPLPWTLGSLTAAAVIAMAGLDWKLPSAARNAARPIIGVMAGSAFTAEVARSMGHWWEVILPLVSFLVVITLAGRMFFTRFCGFDKTTAFFASTPGGLSELTLIGAQYGGNIRQLVLIHSTRIVTVVFLVPFVVRLLFDLEGVGKAAPVHASEVLSALDWLALVGCAAIGYFIGRPLKMVGGIMVVPLILSAIVHGTGLTYLPPPPWLVAIVQVIIGCVAGSRFAGVQWHEIRTSVVQGLAWTAIMLIAALAAAILCSTFVDASVPALLLAFAPGGIAEMTIVAFGMGIEVAFVVCCHVFRSIFLIAAAPVLYRGMHKG